jgi:hypothetical protein
VLNLPSYLPEPLLAKYESIKSTILSWMRTLGILQGVVDSTAGARSLGYTSPLVKCIDGNVESARAQEAFHEAERSLKLTVEEKSKAEEELADLFSPEGFGLEGEWKKLEGTCLELDTGECVPCCTDFKASWLIDQLTDTFTRYVSLTKPNKSRNLEGLLSVWGKLMMQRSVVVQHSQNWAVQEIPGVERQRGSRHTRVLYKTGIHWRRQVLEWTRAQCFCTSQALLGEDLCSHRPFF